MKKELLKNEFCLEKWKTMELTPSGKFCAQCNAELIDLTELPISEIIQDHLGSNKCVRLTDSQIDFLSFYKAFRKTAVISSIVVSSAFFNASHAQSTEKSTLHKDSCLITGRAFFNDAKRDPSRNVSIYITADGVTYETKTDQDGNFAINLPKNCKVFYSNLKKLDSKKIKNRNKINLGKNKIKREKRRIGWL